MSKSDIDSNKKKHNKTVRWVAAIFLTTIVISALISFVSAELMAVSSMAVAFVILLLIVLLGIVFDIVGVAVTSADEKPFHSMAAHKVNGSQQAIRLIHNAERVSSICNDVIGDICGVVSGAAAATITTQILVNFEFTFPRVISLVMSALVAGLTVGGKAIGKTYAIGSCTQIVLVAGKVIWFFQHMGKRSKNKE